MVVFASRQTSLLHKRDHIFMEARTHLCTILRDEVRNGVMVAMGDSVPSFYPASALHAKVSLEELAPTESDMVIVSIDRREDGSLIVEFSDGSIANFTVAELVKIRPDRIIPVNDQLR